MASNLPEFENLAQSTIPLATSSTALPATGCDLIIVGVALALPAVLYVKQDPFRVDISKQSPEYSTTGCMVLERKKHR